MYHIVYNDKDPIDAVAFREIIYISIIYIYYIFMTLNKSWYEIVMTMEVFEKHKKKY